jgi:hypothetical protein
MTVLIWIAVMPICRLLRTWCAPPTQLGLSGRCAGLVSVLIATECLSTVPSGAEQGRMIEPLAGQWADGNAIVSENQFVGSSVWQPVNPPNQRLTLAVNAEDTVGGSTADVWQRLQIEGYADHASVVPGGTIGFYVSTTSPLYDLNISRMGWYDGQGGHLLQTVTALPGIDQPIPSPDPDTGLVAANWELSYSLYVPENWLSGIYLVRLLAHNETQDFGYIVFVVRDDTQVADFVYKVAVNTYQAYNIWGGKSLYDYQSTDGAASKVSFDRPYAQWRGAGHFFEWDFPMIRWLEREGYNVTYITDLDAHESNAYQVGRRVLLSVGHDEYWSKEMRDGWEAARDAHHALAFFSGNVSYWQVRLEPSARGVANRVLVCYKFAARDPLWRQDNSRVTVMWRDEVVGRPENALVGVMGDGKTIPYGQDDSYVVLEASHWILAGTAARPGEAWSRIVGYEWDHVVDNGRTPPDLVILAKSPVVDVDGRASVADSVYYRQGGMVFAAGTLDWSWALDDSRVPDRVDPRIQRMTANILGAFRQGEPPPEGGPSRAAGLPPMASAGVVLAVALAAVCAVWLVRRRWRERPATEVGYRARD